MRTCCVIFVGMFLLLGGCEAPPDSTALPRLDEVRSQANPPQRPNQDNLPSATALVNIQRITLSLKLPTDTAWEAIDENAFPQVTRSVWNANGLRIGLIHSSTLDAMAEGLPQAQSIQNKRILSSNHPMPIRRSPKITGTVTVDLTIPPMSIREERFTGGRAQLLMHVTETGMLYLTPHHHKIKTSLTPRPALEKELDGRIFNELSIGITLGRHDVLVVGLYRPWPLLPQVEDETEKDDTADAPPQYDLSKPPELTNNLGRALLTGGANGNTLQLLLLITLDPLSGNPQAN